MKFTIYHIIGFLFFFKIGATPTLEKLLVEYNNINTFYANSVYVNHQLLGAENEISYLIDSTSFSNQKTNSVSYLSDFNKTNLPVSKQAVAKDENDFLSEGKSSYNGVAKYVKVIATGDGSGSDWDNALGSSDLKTTIEAGGTVYIAAGTYAPGLQIDIATNVCVIGGFPNAATGTEICTNYDPITNQTTIDGAASHRLIRVTSSAATSLEFRGLVLSNGDAASGGGPAILIEQVSSAQVDYKFIDLKVNNNDAGSTGFGSIFLANQSHVNSEVLFQNCVFHDNNIGRGGALSFSQFYNTSSSSDPNNGNLVVEYCSFYDNNARGSGGGAFNLENAHQWTIRNSDFCGNTASVQNGGALRFFQSYSNEIIDCDIANSEADDDGGAIWASATKLLVSGCNFVSCVGDTLDQGGAIHGTNITGIDVINSTFYNNRAGAGGAIFMNSTFNNSGTPNLIINCTFKSNEAFKDADGANDGGGAVKSFNANMQITSSTFVDNLVTSTGFGGAINNYGADIELVNNIFYNNQKGTANSILGADIIAYNTSTSFTPMSGNKMQLAAAVDYVLQNGSPSPGSYNFTDDTFSNTDDGSVPIAPSIVCSSTIGTPNAPTGCATFEICGNGIDDNGDGRIDEAYPGGVQSNLQLWLDAENGLNTDIPAAAVNSWADRSANFYSANANGNATDFPTYSSNSINYHPGVTFDGTYTDDFSDGLHLGDDYIFSEEGGMEIFSIVKPTVGTTESTRFVVDFGSTNLESYGLAWSAAEAQFITPGAFGGTNTLFSHSNGVNPTLIEMKVAFGDAQSLLQNGTQVASDPIASLAQITNPEIKEDNSYLISNAGPVSIGRQSKVGSFTSDKIFDGTIAEVLIYDDTLSQSDKEKVNSYLAIKYGLELPHNYVFSDGTIIKDVTDGYANDIAGIAVDSCGALIQKQSKSVDDSAIVSIASASFAVTNSANSSAFLTDKAALVWGHNGAAVNSSWSGANYDIPNGGYLGIDRVWKFTETQDVQNVALRVDVDDPQFDLPMLPPYPSSDGSYYIFIDDDGDFTNGGTTVQQLNFISASLRGITIADPANSYFSFGIKIPEICNDGVDNDGDGAIDCQDEDCSVQYYAAAQTNIGVLSGDNVLGAPDFLSAIFGDGDQMTIDLGNILGVGEDYTLDVVTFDGSLTIEESIDGVNFFASSASPYTVGGASDITITTTVHTRFVRLIFPPTGSNDLILDAVTYDHCDCQSAINLVGEYSINAAPDIAGDSVLIFEGDNLRLDFVGTFNSEVFVWTGPNSLYQVNDSGTLRDHLILNNIQINQSGTYYANMIDTLGCMGLDSFFVNVVVPEICNNGIDDDGDGDIDCADSDCNTTYYAVSQVNDGSVSNPNDVLGAPDGQGAGVGAGPASYIIDLGSILDVGEEYILTLTYLLPGAQIVIDESLDGINFATAAASPFTITSPTLADEVFTTTVHTRYLRISSPSSAFIIDAVSYGNCICQPAASMVEEYQINAEGFVIGATVPAEVGENVTLNFVGGGFDDWVFVWTGPNFFYQITDTGDGNSRDQLTLNNIQTNQAGVYTVFYFDPVGCVDSTTFTVNVSVPPEICNNGIDDDGDGDIDCADSDCNTTYYATAQTNTGSVLNPESLLGAPDGQVTTIGTATSMVVDLGSALDIGEDYTLTIAHVSSGATLAIEESIDGINFFPAAGSPITVPSASLADTTFTTSSHTRYLRLTAGATIVRVDAITYGNCICQPVVAMVEEYEINAGGFVTGSIAPVFVGDDLILNFDGGGFDDWVFIWTGPNSFYQVTDTGDGNARDRLVLTNIQANQIGEYKVVYYDNVGCVDSTSFTVNLLVPEICDNGIDDDGDGDIDCADSDCAIFNYAISQTSVGVVNPSFATGATDDLYANITVGDTMVIDLGVAMDTSIVYFIRGIGNNIATTVEESIDGVNFFTNSASPYNMSIGAPTSYAFTTEVHTRYLRLTFEEVTLGAASLSLDAAFNYGCICQPTPTMTEEYQIDFENYFTGTNATAVQGNHLRLEFIGNTFDDWTFIWTGPNSFYQVTDSGTDRDRIDLSNIQANQAGDYKVVYFDDDGCVDSTTFTVTVLTPEICNNGLDDDGDGNVDCADGDCSGVDTDGDTICDAYDLDDDNDGIPDLEEGHCPTYEFGFEADREGWWQDNLNDGNIQGRVIHSSSLLTSEGCTMSNIPANPAGNFIMADDTYGGTMHFESLNNLNADLSNKLNGEFSFNWINGTYDGITGTQDPGVAVMEVNLTGGGTTITTTFDATGLANIGIWTTFTFDLDDATWSGTAADLLTVLSDLDRIEIEMESISGKDWSVSDCTDGEYFGLGNVAFSCESRDTDNDLVADYLDLDSDNDGIYDVDEAGHGQTDADGDGVIDGTPTLFGLNGLFNNIETVTDNGTISYVIADSETTPDGVYDAYELDADADACFDTQEEGIVDGDADGIAGTGAPLVDGSGLVNGNVYTTPTNNEWQNPLLNNSCSTNCEAKAPVISKK